MLSGDGQITPQNNQAQDPLTVLATDASGKPLPGVTVNWSLSGPGILPIGDKTVTGPDGQTSNRFVGVTIYGDTAFTQTVVTASAGSSSVSMHETTSGSDIVSGSVFVQIFIVSPVLGDVISDTGPAPIVKVQVTAIHQAGVQQVPNVAVTLIPDIPGGPSLACAPGTNLTDVNGLSNCRVVFSGPTGSGSFSIEVGSFRTFSPFQFTITQRTGQPAAIVVTGGANQSGLPGAQLPTPLTARVQDASGKPLPNVTVVWQPVNPQAVSLSNVASVSDSNGIVSAIARLGSIVGTTQVQVRTTTGAGQATFNLTTLAQTTPPPTGGGPGTAASILITGGNNQSGLPGATLPSPLTAKIVDSAGNGVPGVAVTWQPATAQSVSLSSIVSTSDSNGNVSAVATLGSSLGAAQVQVRATTGGTATPFGVAGGTTITSSFNLTVVQTQPGPAPGALPTSFRITGGNNQSGAPGAKLPTQLMAQVVDSVGNPVARVPVTWQPVNPQSVSLSGVVSTSDANGMVSAIATLGSTPGAAQVQLQSTASVSQTPFGTAGSPISATFNLTVTLAQPSALNIVSGNNQSGAAGAQLPQPLVARVVDGAGNPVPNVAVVWQPPSSVSLSNVVSTSDANGVVSAVAKLGPTPGPSQVQLRAANGAIQTTFSLSVNQPQPANLRILSGNNQAGPAGSQLPGQLMARVEDASGNPVPNVAVIWQPLNPSAVSLSGLIATSDANGLVSAVATLGSSAGTAQVQVKVANASVQTVFTLQATLTVTGIAITAGGNQQTTPGGDFAQPLTALLTATGGTAAGFPVQFTSSGAPVFLSNGGLGVTDSNGRASVSLQAGSVAGTAIITATAVGFSASISVTIAPPLVPLSFFNGASLQPAAITPAGVVAIYGTGVAPGVTGCVSADQSAGQLPLSLSSVTVQFANSGYVAPAPVFSVCNLGPGQEYIVVQAPADLPLADTTVTVQSQGSSIGQSTAPATPVNPGIFASAMSDGTKRAVLRRPDGSNVSLENPAQPGERLQVFVTGLGRPVSASGIAINTNQTGIPGDDASPPNPVTVNIGGSDLQPVSAVYATDMIGVYVITFDVPPDAPAGNDISFSVSTVLPDQSVAVDSTTLPIQPAPSPQ